jgi:hypothetical protein
MYSNHKLNNESLARMMVDYLQLNDNCRNPSLGFTTKVRACKGVGQKSEPKSHISCSQECKRVWGNEPSHSQMNSHFGNWSPNGLPNLQRVIIRVKTHWIEMFFISLKRSWNIDVWNGLTWPIWTPKTQVMAKWKDGSQIGNLIPNH